MGVKLRDDSSRISLVAYMPRETGVEERAAEMLEPLLARAPVATLRAWAITTS